MKTLIPLVALFFLMFSCKPTDQPGPKDPNPGDLTAKSNQVSMTAKRDGQDWEASFVLVQQAAHTDSKGEFHQFIIQGKTQGETEDPGILMSVTRYGTQNYGTGTYDVKDFFSDNSGDRLATLLYKTDDNKLFFLDNSDPETRAEFTVQSLNGDKASGTWSMKLKAVDGTYTEFTNGEFKTNNYEDFE